MENKKLGLVLIIISLIIGSMLTYYSSNLVEHGKEIGCFPNEECVGIERALNFSHLSIGIFAFLLALGFYLVFFNKSERAILDRLETEKNQKIEEMKFDILLRAMDPFERKVLKIVKEQEGITQNTLRIKTDMSKAKLSYVLQELEKRDIIKRIKKGKTLAIYLKV